VRFLTDELVERIVAEGRELLCKLGVEIENAAILGMLGDHGATFTIASFEVMKNLQVAVRGNVEVLAAKPLTMFSCCPTSPRRRPR
jgi:hypothetical protein